MHSKRSREILAGIIMLVVDAVPAPAPEQSGGDRLVTAAGWLRGLAVGVGLFFLVRAATSGKR